MDTVYVKTTVIGNVAGRMHPDPLVASRQRLTRKWWSSASNRFRLVISQLVLEECSAGDPDAATERIQVIGSIELLEMSNEIESLADKLLENGALPVSQPRDALHIAFAAVHGIQYLVTWNFKHIANATRRKDIERTCRKAGFEPPAICTPEELAEKADADSNTD